MSKTKEQIFPELTVAQAEAAEKRQKAMEARAKVEALTAESENRDEVLKEAKAALADWNAAKAKVESLQEQLAALTEFASLDEQKSDKPAEKGDQSERKPADLASRFFQSDAYEYLKSRGATNGGGVQFGSSPRVELISAAEFKTTMTTGSYPIVPQRLPEFALLPQVQPTILDLISIVQTNVGTVEYVTETTFTNAAAETAEGSAAPEGALAYSKQTVSLSWLPFLLPASRQLLSDEARMQSFINDRLILGIKQRLQSQIISGNGTSPNLRGIVNTTGVLTQAKGTDTVMDQILKAKVAVINATNGDYVPNTLLINPADYQGLVLSKATTNEYLLGGPLAADANRFWGMTPVVHVAVPSGTPIVCDISQAELYVREGVTVSVSDSHSDFFAKGLLAFLAEGRFGFAVLQPKAFCICAAT